MFLIRRHSSDEFLQNLLHIESTWFVIICIRHLTERKHKVSNYFRIEENITRNCKGCPAPSVTRCLSMTWFEFLNLSWIGVTKDYQALYHNRFRKYCDVRGIWTAVSTYHICLCLFVGQVGRLKSQVTVTLELSQSSWKFETNFQKFICLRY